MNVQLLGFAPDADPTIKGVLTACSGVVPSLKGLKGAPTPVSAGMATLAATCQGAAVLAKLDGTNRFFAGTGVKLYEGGSSTWADVSRAAAYTMSGAQRWRFAQFGNTSIAANGADTMQASVSAGAFSCIPGAPIAAITETVGAFVFGANTSAGSNIVQWSGINNYATWVASIATQSGSDTLTATSGAITAIKRFGNALIVYKRDSMFLGVYVGPPNVWTINSNQIVGNAGAISQESVVNIGTSENPKHIFMGIDNFYLYDGAKPVPIGTNRVKNAVFNVLLQSRASACTALHDKANTLVYFFYPLTDSNNPDKCVVYNYRTDMWGVDDRQVQATIEFVPTGVTYDGLGGLYATYNDLPNVSYDSAFTNSVQATPSVFDTTNSIKMLTGAAANTSITTGDLGDDQLVTMVNRVRPRFLTKPTSSTWTPQYRMNPGDTLSSDSAVSLSAYGAFDFMREARWHKGIMNMSGDWELGVLNFEVTEGSLE